ncbi:hypothetical protein GCM10027592_38300 [Spirosoma flavus]
MKSKLLLFLLCFSAAFTAYCQVSTGQDDPERLSVRKTKNSRARQAAAADVCAGTTLATSYISNNGSRGVMFDIEATNTVTITCFDASLYASTTADYEIYYKIGSYKDSETTATDWTFVGRTNAVSSLGVFVPTPLPIPVNVVIPAGQKVGFYVTNTVDGGVNYTTSATEGVVVGSDANITITGGVGKRYPFSETFRYRLPNITAHYVSPLDPTITGFAASPNQGCAGTPVTFTATVGNVTGSYAYTITNGTSTTTGITSTTSLSQNLTAAGSGLQAFTLIVTASGQSASATTNVTVNSSPTAELTNNGPLSCTMTNVTLTASGGNSYTFVNPNGTVLGTSGPTTTRSVSLPGTYSVIVGNASGCTSTTSTTVARSNEVTVNNIQKPTTTTATVGTPFMQSFSVVYAITEQGQQIPPGTTVTLEDGTLPPGLNLSSTGVLSGTPTQAGSYSLTVRATIPSSGCTAVSPLYTLVVNPAAPPTITGFTTLDNTVCVGQPVTITATIGNVTGSYDYTIEFSNHVLFSYTATSGSFSQGLATQVPGNQTIKLTVISNGQSTSALTNVTINSLPTAGLTNNGPRSCTLTNVTLTASGGTSYTFVNSSGNVLGGSGNTRSVSAPGTYSVTVANANGCVSTTSTTVSSNTATLFVTNPNITTATVGTAFSQTFVTSYLNIEGNTGTTRYSLANGTLPNGLTLSVGGVLSGTPTQSGSFLITVRGTDSVNGCTDDGATYTLVVNPAQAPCGTVVYVTQNGAGSQNGSSWNNAFAGTSLQTAINTAATCGAQVWVAQGIYRPTTGTDRSISFVLKEGVAIYGGFSGTEGQLGDRPGVNPVTGAPSSSTLSGDIGQPDDNSDNSNYVVRSDPGLTASAVLDGFVIRGGSSTIGTSTIETDGLYNVNASPTVRNCFFVNNLGHDIFNQNSRLLIANCRFEDGGSYGSIQNNGPSSLTITGSLFRNTSGAIYNSGNQNANSLLIKGTTFQGLTEFGAIYNSGNSNFSLEMEDCVVRDNRTYTSTIYCSGGSVVLRRCQFIDNTRIEQEGGAISLSGGNLDATDCYFTGNSASDGGGAIAMSNITSTLRLTNCVFEKNKSTGSDWEGGSVASNGTAIIINTRFESNTAAYGGGLALTGANNNQLINCSFVGNVATQQGGALIARTSLQVANSSFLGNQGSEGGAIYNGIGGTTQLVNSVLFNNGGSNSFKQDEPLSNPALVASYSLFEPTVTNFADGSNNLTTTLSPFASTTSTQLANCSPAINSGSNTAYSAASGPATDLAGNGRQYNGSIIDRGAYEYQGIPTTLTVSNPTVSTAAVGQAFSQSFTASGGSGAYSYSVVSTNLPASLSLLASGVLSGTPTQAGSYSVLVRAQDANGCVGIASQAYTLQVLDQTPVITSFAGSPATVCAGSPVTFTATVGNVTGSYNYTLTNGGSPQIGSASGNFSLNVPASGSGVQSFTLLVSSNGQSATATTNVTVSSPASATIAYAGSPFSTTAVPVNVTRTGTAGGTYTASPAGLSINASTGQITPASSSPGNYIVTYTFAASGGCPVFTTTTPISIQSLSADLSITVTDGVTTAIPGGSVTYTITASNAGPSAVTAARVTDTFPAVLTCTWTAIGSGGGTVTASGSGNINELVNLPSGGSVTFTATCAVSSAATGTLSNTARVTATNGESDPTPGNNAATDTDTFTPQADLSITLTDGATTVVPGGSVSYTITASNNGPSSAPGAIVVDIFPTSLTGISWTASGNGGATVTPSGSGNISQAVNLPVGSSVVFVVTATLNSAATGTLTNTATVSAPGGVSDSSLGNNSATDSNTISSLTPTIAGFSGSPNSVCADSPLTFTATVGNVTGSYNYTLTNGGSTSVTGSTSTSSLSQTLIAAGSGSQSFSLLVSSNGQLATATTNVTINALPVATLTANLGGTLTCAQSSLTLTATGGTSYSFAGPGIISQNVSSGTAVVSASGTYSVTATTSGCSSTTSLTIFQDSTVPTVSITPSSATLTCATSSVSLSATGSSGTYRWNTGETSSSISATSAATYSVTLTATNGCTATALAQISQDSNAPLVSITPNSATLTCASPVISLSATGSGTYRWSTGATSQAISVSTATTYSVTLTAANGCTATTSVTVVQDSNVPTVSITPSIGTPTGATLTCANSTVTLTATGTGTYRWSTGATSQTITANTADTYSVTITATNGCTATASIQVFQDSNVPSVSITPSSATLTCANPSATLVATGSGTFRWNTGETSASISVSAAATYSVTITASNGCTATTTASVVQDNALPTITISANPSLTISAGQSATLTASGATAYRWDNGATTSFIVVNSPGTYSVSGTVGNCQAVASATVYQVSAPAGPFAITAVVTNTCQQIASNRYVISVTPQFAGLNGQPVSVSIVNEMFPTTAPGPYTLQLYNDNPTITFKAQQSGTVGESSFAYNWLAACQNPQPNTPPRVNQPLADQQARVGEGFGYTLPQTTFTDNESPNSLVVSVTGLPAGLSFNPPTQIGGVPTVAGVSSVTVTATDPGGLSVSTTFLLTVSEANATNTPPRVVNPIVSQVGIQGQPFSLNVSNTFTDSETPNALTLTASGLPQGLNLVGTVITGTPSQTGTSTINLTALDPGGLSASTSFVLTVQPSSVTASAPFAITGVSPLTCTQIANNRYEISFTPRYSGLNGQAVSFWVVNELFPTTAPGPYSLQLYNDNPTILLKAKQEGTADEASFSYNWLASCSAPQPNTPPRVNIPLTDQTAKVGQEFGYTIPQTTFTDNETPHSLVLSVSGLPAGLSFSPPTQIGGVPSVSGVSSVTVTATDPGGLSVSSTFVLTVNPASNTVVTPPTPGAFAITGVSLVECQALGANRRSVRFTPQYSGLSGEPVSFSIVNEMLPTTAAGPYTLELYTDNAVLRMRAQQGSTTTSYDYNWLAACNSPARQGVAELVPLGIVVQGNPVEGDYATIKVTGADGQPLQLRLTSEQGHSVSEQMLPAVESTATYRVRLGRSSGVYLLDASTPTQRQVVKILKR